MGAQPSPIPYILGEGVNYLTLRVQFYANECKKGRVANPSSNVLHSSSLLLKVIWRCSTSLLHYMFSIIWFLNHHMVSQNMVSQSSYGSIIWFLNHHMVPLYGFSIIICFHYMVSQSSYGFHYMVSQSSYGSIIWFLNHHMVSIIWFLNHRMVPLCGFSIIIWFHYMVS